VITSCSPVVHPGSGQGFDYFTHDGDQLGYEDEVMVNQDSKDEEHWFRSGL